ncbi:MAG: Stealth CR1 domain-containing protein [Flavobacteriaceae bacterium]
MENKKSPEIDAVIAWVDGSDPVLINRQQKYLKLELNKNTPGAEKTRFNSLNEIKYCLISILKFAPYLRKIFIVTDRQDPNVYPLVQTYFPKRISDIHLVDHTEIFKGFESFLPTFNSICISNMLWKIKGLSDQFIYFNDDVFLIRPTKPSTFFQNNKPVLRGKWRLPPYERILWDKTKYFFEKLFMGVEKEKTPSFQINQWNAAKLVGFNFRFFMSGHVPLALNKKKLQEYFTNNPEILKQNIVHRFRSYNQFNTVSLANHIEYNNGNFNVVSSNGLYIKPHKRNDDYILKKFLNYQKDKEILFLCVQSLDLASKSIQFLVQKQMNEILEVNLQIL